VSAANARFWIVLAVVSAVCGATTHGRVFSAGNDASRWAQIESIVDHGRTTIERSRFRATVDRVVVGEREYSNKPPLLSLVGAALYAPLQAVTGWKLADPATGAAAIRVLTFLLVGLPGAWAAACFDRALGRAGAAPRAALVAALAFGTLLWSFGGTLNNHVPAAALLLAATLAARDGRALASGLACGFAGAVDLLPGFGMAPFLLVAVAWPGATRRARAIRFVAGVAVGLAAAIAANLYVTGTPLPPKLLPGAVDLAAQAGPSRAGVVLPESPWYPLEVLFGWHGLLLVSPVLVVGVWGLARACRSGLPAGGTPIFWRAVAAGVGAQWLGHALVAGSYGGWSYGYRYLLPVTPLLLLAAPAATAAPAGRQLLWAALPVSILFAALGVYHPWPPAYEQAATRDPVASTVTNPIGGNAAAFCVERWPESAACARLTAAFVSPEPAAARRYFVYFFGSKGDLATMRRFER
jgi:hypothetical protein